MNKPKVSILCLAYNQKSYISQALDSFLMQETDFDFEILIHDDASTDGTTEIIKAYQENYPKIVKPIYQKHNQYSKGIKITPTYQLPRATGEYIALCEGDDYWTDTKKLQLQVDFLEKHPDYSLCFHPVRVIFENGEKPDYIIPSGIKGFSAKKLLRDNFIPTNSVMYRRQNNYNALQPHIVPGDWNLHLYHAQFGKIGYIDKVMAVYRKHPGGIWWENSNSGDAWGKLGIALMSFYAEILKLYGNERANKKIIEKSIDNTISSIIEADISNKSKIIEHVVITYPEHIASYLIRNHKKNQKHFDEFDYALKTKDIELNSLKLSRVWKARNKAVKLMGRK